MSNPNSYGDPDGTPGPALDKGEIIRIQLVAAAVIAAPVIYAIVSYLQVHFVMEEGKGFILESGHFGFMGPVVGVALSFAFVALTFPFRRMLIQTIPITSIDAATRVMLLSLAVAGAGGIVGLVYVLLTGEWLNGVIMMSLSFWGMCLFFPTRRWLEDNIKPA